MKSLIILIFALTLVVNIHSQTRYFQAYRVQFYDGNFNLIETSYCDKVIKISDNNHTVIIGGSIAFQLFGQITKIGGNTVSQMARPDDGSDNCRVIIASTSRTTTRISFVWTNMTVAYDCRN